MDAAIPSLLLLAATAAALAYTRGRMIWVQLAAETLLLVAIGSFLVWHHTSPLPFLGKVPVGAADIWFRALAVIWWLIGAKLVVTITVLVRGRDPKSREARLFSDLGAALIYIATILIILNSVLNLNVRGLLVTSGVIAIVLGLALQNTLADVFSGIAVGLEQPFHVGDRVSVGDNLEGVIVQMNWRSLRIQTDDDDLAILPNSLVAKSQIVNRSVPTRHRAATVEIMAPPDVFSETIIELIRQATLLCPTLLTVPAPSITLRRSGLHSSTYAASFFVADTPQVAAAKSSLLRQVRRLFHHAGIGRPSPLSPGELLGSLVLFEALSAQELADLCKDLISRGVEPGDTIFERGSVATAIYVVEAGILEAFHHDAKSAGRVGPGEYIGDIGLFTRSPRACTLKALTHGRILELPGDDLCRLLQSNKALNIAMERSVRKGLAQLDRDDAVKAEQPSGQALDVLARIRAFFEV